MSPSEVRKIAAVNATQQRGISPHPMVAADRRIRIASRRSTHRSGSLVHAVITCTGLSELEALTTTVAK